MLGIGLVREEFSYFVVGFYIGHRIRARRLADGVLIDHLDRFQKLHVASQSVEIARFDARVVQHAPQRRVENTLCQRRLSRAADARDAGHHAQRNPHVDVAQVVFPGAFDGYRVAPPAFGRRNGYFAPPREVVGREAFPAFQQLRQRAAENHFAAVVARFGTDVHDPVRRADHLFLVLHDDHRVAQVAQLFQHADQAVGVARMQSDRGFVEDVERPREVAAQRCREVDALALAAREGR